MIRFLCYLFGWEYEPCKTCEVLKQQLAVAQGDNAKLVDSIISIAKPETYETGTTSPIELTPRAIGMPSRQRAFYEARDRKTVEDIKRHSSVIGKADDPKDKVDELEEELGIKQNAS